MEPPLWTEVEFSPFQWEREALAYLRAGLPNHEPYRAWSNIEFIAENGSINEVDCLVVAPKGLFLVEIKSHPGIIKGDQQRWTWTWRDGSSMTVDNPVLLANAKSKRLRSLLQRQPAFRRETVPFVTPLVFLSSEQLDCRLHPIGRQHVTCRDGLTTDTAFPLLPGVLQTLKDPSTANLAGHQIDKPMSKRLADALGQLGIRPNTRHRRLGDWDLGEVLDEGEGWQDFLGTQLGRQRRVRIYLARRAHTAEEAEQLQRTARREFRLLDSVRHSGIAHPLDLQQHEWGPALLFERANGEERLDLWLDGHLDRLDLYDRLDLVRDLAEALDYAHRHGLTHRALVPRNILVRPPSDGIPRAHLVISNWQSSTRELATTLSRFGSPADVGAQLTEADQVFLAPELATDAEPDGVRVDLFSLGAIAYLLLSGRAPGATPFERTTLLQERGYFPLDAVLDGAPEALVLAIESATQAVSVDRLDSAAEFLTWIDEALDELTRPDAPPQKDPLEANRNDELEGGWRVLRRLGKGSTALALLAERAGSLEVLKVALDEDQAERLRAEQRALGTLRSRSVVECHGIETIGGRTVLRLTPAGDVTVDTPDNLLTLGERIRRDGRVGLDLLPRFGDDLLEVVAQLEDDGIAHRDIKPDNLGVRMRGKNNELHLVLFDFSLTTTPPEQVRAGTPGYLDPFLDERRPPRWDLAAERYAAAVTLYEMATGVRPRWGDGTSDPLLLDDLLPRIDADLFDVAVRDELTAFFERTLHRKPANRFDTAEEMRRTWHHVFARPGTVTVSESPTFDPAELDRLASAAASDTAVAELGLSAAALGTLERLGVTTAGGLAGLALTDSRLLRGVGHRVRTELRAASRRLQHLTTEPEPDEHARSVDAVLALCLPRGNSPTVEADLAPTRDLLGLTDGGEPWPSLVAVATRCGLDRVEADQLLDRARKRWLKATPLTGIRDDIAQVLAASGGLATGDEIALVLLDRRGSTAVGPERLRRARAVVRAAIEAEAGRTTVRFRHRRFGTTLLLAAETAGVDAQELTDYAAALGPLADDLALADPLVSVKVAVERLRTEEPPFGFDPLSDTRLVRLAAACSQRAAASSRLELYPRGLAAERALGLARSSLLGVGTLSEEQLRARVQTRFPEAAPLPDRPALDRLVVDLVGLEWFNPAGADEAGYRVPPAPEVSPTTYPFGRSPTRLRSGTHHPVNDDDARVALDADARLRTSLGSGGFVAVTVPPRLLLDAEAALAEAFTVDVVDAEAALVDAMRAVAAEKHIRWESAVLSADAAGADGPRWDNLTRVARLAADRVEADLLTRRAVLLTRPGLLARYGLADPLLDRLRDRTTITVDRNQTLRTLWVLIATDDPAAKPAIDGVVVPVSSTNQWLALPEAWLRNAHRAGTGAT